MLALGIKCSKIKIYEKSSKNKPTEHCMERG